MGCGAIWIAVKGEDDRGENESEIKILQRRNTRNSVVAFVARKNTLRQSLRHSFRQSTVFVEDIDDVKNEVANRRNSVHFDIVKMADNMLKSAESNKQKADVFVMKAEYYYKVAIGLLKKADFDYFTKFRKSHTNFLIANKLDMFNTNSIIGIAKCLLRLQQTRKAFEYLEDAKNNKDLVNTAEFWYLYGVASRKCAKIWSGKSNLGKKFENMALANECFTKALGLTATNTGQANAIFKDKGIHDNLVYKQTTFERNIFNYTGYLKKNAQSTYERLTTTRFDKKLFKILSVDGGGIKGILPSILLTEIEKRCHSYLTDVFDCFAGASTGGILTAAITMPQSINSDRPLYSMGECLQFYLDNGSAIFPDTSIFKLIFSQKYSSKPIYDVLTRTYKGLHLSQTLKNLIIPAVNCDGPLRTDFFTSYDARNSLDKDILIVDAIMATTAAPTFFAPYKIKGLGCYIDGSLNTPSPAKKAYEDARYRFNKKKDEIYVVSLGTGQHASIMFEENFSESKSKLFWTARTPGFIMAGHEHNTDVFLRHELNNNYKRFQFYYEQNLPIDIFGYASDLLDIGTEYVEEKNDEINKVVEILLAQV